MEGFQRIVLYSAIIILILILLLIGVGLSFAKKESWPPMVPSCPDYWTIDGSGNDAKCVNIKKLGTGCTAAANSPDPKDQSGNYYKINFNKAPYNGAQGACNKYKWAHDTCKVSWDGITYGVNNPCST